MESKCTNPQCEQWPVYGVAPHTCYWKLGKQIGQSELAAQHNWPDNFVLELEPGEKIEDVKYPNATGIYFCPTCKRGMKSWVEKSNGTLVTPHIKGAA